MTRCIRNAWTTRRSAGTRTATLAAIVLAVGIATAYPASADTGTYYNSGDLTPTTTGTLGTGVGQKLTGAEMVQRAKDWATHQVSYDQSRSFSDAEVGGPYRTDCGGLVDMAWQLPSSPVVTTPAPGIDSSTYSTKLTSWSQLQPGDALAVSGEHINLFAGWTNQANGDFTYIAEDNPSVRTAEYPANIHDADIDGYATSSFELLRSNNLAPSTGTAGVAATSDSGWQVHNPDTRTMTVFGLGSGGHLGFTESSNGGGSWSNWAEVNGYWTLQGTPDAVYDPATRTTMVFARGSADRAMGVSTSTNNGASWSDWAQVNAYWSNFEGDASAVYNPDTHRVTVFARGGDGSIGYSQSGNGGASWSNWAQVNAYWGNFSGDPHAIYDPSAKRITVFARGGDGRIGYTQSANDGASWSNWAEVNAYWNNFSGDPHVVINSGTHQLTVFARGGDGSIGYTQSGNGGASWSNWAQVNAYWGNFSGDPHAIYDPSAKRITVFARGGDGSVGYTQSGNGGASWSNWAQVNAYWNNFTGDPVGVYDPDTAQDTIFALGSGGHLGYTQSGKDEAGWSNWAEVNAYWTLIGS